jgi:hypothetical protein
MATGVAKPNGVLAVPAQDTATFVASRPAKELHGVGRQTYAKLAVLVRAFRASPERGAEVADDIKRHGREAKALANAEAVRRRLAAGKPFNYHEPGKPPPPQPAGAQGQPQPKLVAPSGAHQYHPDPRPPAPAAPVDASAAEAAEEGGGNSAAVSDEDPAALLEGLSCRDLLIVPAAAMRAALGRNLGEAMRKMLLGEDGRVAKRTGTTDGLKPPLSVGCTMNYALRMAAFGELLRVFTDVVKDVVGKLDRHGLAAGSLKVTVLERHPTYRFFPEKSFGCGKCVERSFPVRFETGGEWRVNKLLDAITPGLRELVGDAAAGARMRPDTAEQILNPERLGTKETPSATLRGIAIDAAAAAAAAAAPTGGEGDMAAAAASSGSHSATAAVPVWDVRGVGLIASMLVPRQALLDREQEQQRRGVHAVQQVSLTAAFRAAQERRTAAGGAANALHKRPRKTSSSLAPEAAVDVDEDDDDGSDDSVVGSSVVVHTLGSNTSDVVAGTATPRHCHSSKAHRDPARIDGRSPDGVVDLLLSGASAARSLPAPPRLSSVARAVDSAVARGAADTLQCLAGFGGIESCADADVAHLRELLTKAFRSVQRHATSNTAAALPQQRRAAKQHRRDGAVEEAPPGADGDAEQPWVDVVLHIAPHTHAAGDDDTHAASLRRQQLVVLAVAAVLRASAPLVAATAATKLPRDAATATTRCPSPRRGEVSCASMVSRMAALEHVSRRLRIAACRRHAAVSGGQADARNRCAAAVVALIHGCVGPNGWALQLLQPKLAEGEAPRSRSAMFGAPDFAAQLA